MHVRRPSHRFRYHSSRTLLIFLATILVSILCSRGLRAQDAAGAIEGLVTDSTRAQVAGASVSLKDIDTNAVRNETTNGEGRYRFALLHIVRYMLTVDSGNFAHYSQGPIDVSVSQTIQLNIQLTLASVKESVLVEGTAPTIDTSTNTLGK